MIPSRHPNLVLIQKRQASTGGWNDIVTWVEDRQAWVSINPDRGREIFRGDELQSVVTHTIRGDFYELEGIEASWRIIYNDTHEYGPSEIRADSLVFDILAVMLNFDGRDDIMIQANALPLRYGDLPENVPQ